jgi:hypothetical protein
MASTLKYAKPEQISLKAHADFNEKWLQDRIGEDPGILGLGDLVVIDRERRQERAGRLDLLLADLEEDRRFEVELMLGATDESHIIRAIEYWDLERRRYPGYEHCAVLVAEDITSRFLNVLALFAGTIPMIVIQLNALKVGENIVLDFVRVLDQRLLRRDDTSTVENTPADKAYWIGKGSAESVDLADKIVGLINEKAKSPYRLNFNRHYIGLHDGTGSRNFVVFHPRKKHLLISVSVEDGAPWLPRFEEAGFDARIVEDRVRVTVPLGALEHHRALIAELVHEAVEEYQQ